MQDKSSDFPYLHGFSQVEQARLIKQARFAEQSVYSGIDFTDCKHILEVGSGVGAQSEILLRRFPNLNLTGIDRSPHQIEAAKSYLKSKSYCDNRYKYLEMDATNIELEQHSFDGAFLCWVLEHIPNPSKVLSEVRRVLRPGSKIIISEVMNSSFLLDPYSPNVWKYWMAFNDYQYEVGGDPFIGAKLGNLLLGLGYKDISVSTKTWHFDNRNPKKRKEYIDYWNELLLSASEQLIKSEKVTEEIVKDAKEEMNQVSKDPNAVFYYSFIQAQAIV